MRSFYVLLKLLVQGIKDVAHGKVVKQDKMFARLGEKLSRKEKIMKATYKCIKKYHSDFHKLAR